MSFKKKIPMFLTILRFFLIIPYAIFFIIDRPFYALVSFLIYFIASITDWLDGYYARKFECTSKIGAFLDPLADKFLTLTAFFIFSLKNYVYLPAILVGLMLIREYFVTMMRVEIDYFNDLTYIDEKKEIKFVTSKEAKLKTAFQMITIVIFYLFYAVNKKFFPSIKILSLLISFNYLPLILFSFSIILAYYSSYKYIKIYDQIAYQTLMKTFATFFYIGYFPMASGTFASLLTLFIFILLKPTFLFLVSLILFLLLTGLYFSSKLEKKLMVKDPAIIVIDEVTGMFISFLPLTFLSQLTTFYIKFLKLDSSQIYQIVYHKYFYLL
ncbi:MAG: phosphatidylglycerophosphatase A, partial [Exilispira sp.]